MTTGTIEDGESTKDTVNFISGNDCEVCQKLDKPLCAIPCLTATRHKE